MPTLPTHQLALGRFYGLIDNDKSHLPSGVLGTSMPPQSGVLGLHWKLQQMDAQASRDLTDGAQATMTGHYCSV